MDKSKRFPINFLYAAYIEENNGDIFYKNFISADDYTEALRKRDEHDLMGKRLLEVVAKMKPRCQEVIYYYFKYMKTYKEIAGIYGVSPARIGQILHIAYRDLRKPVYADYVVLGKVDDSFSKINLNAKDDGSLVNLHLSNRVYNALARAGIKDTATLVKYASSRPVYLASIRNLGKVGLKEIETTLKERGLISEEVILKTWDKLDKEEKDKEEAFRRLEDNFSRRIFSKLSISQ